IRISVQKYPTGFLWTTFAVTEIAVIRGTLIRSPTQRTRRAANGRPLGTASGDTQSGERSPTPSAPTGTRGIAARVSGKTIAAVTPESVPPRDLLENVRRLQHAPPAGPVPPDRDGALRRLPGVRRGRPPSTTRPPRGAGTAASPGVRDHGGRVQPDGPRSEEHTSELQSRENLV